MRPGPASSALLITAVLLAGCSGAGSGSGAPPSAPTPPPSNPTPPATPQLSITTAVIPLGKVGSPYSTQLSAAYGTGALTWSTNDLLPPGITLSPTGLLSGTPSAPVCPFTFDVKVSDSSSPVQSASATFSFNAGGFAPGLQPAQIGVYYFGSLNLDCGAEPITWTLLAGSLPPGLQMSSSKAIDAQLDFPGLPTQAGTFNLTLQAQDAHFTYQTVLPLIVLPAALNFSDALMQVGVVGKPFDHTVSISGGAPPYNFTVSSGSLPAGLQLNANTGEITGTPQSPGLTQFTVTLTDASNSAQFTIHKPDSILVTPAPLPSRNDTLATATPVVAGTYYASLSPYTDTSGQAAPDQDFYVMSGVNAGETYQVSVSADTQVWNGTYSSLTISSADPALEVLDANGNRLMTCNDPVADSPPSGAPYSAGHANFTDPCVSHGNELGFSNSYVTLQTSSPNQQFYIHVFDFQGRARPDFLYSMGITKK